MTDCRDLPGVPWMDVVYRDLDRPIVDVPLPHEWPQHGRCGACGHPAIAFPSRRWAHAGAPCQARSQTLWAPGDLGLYDAVRFVPEGQPLPALAWTAQQAEDTR